MVSDRELSAGPRLLEIEPARGCNLRCVMCHVPHEKSKPQYIDIDRLRAATAGVTDLHVIVGSEYEPTIHPRFEDLLRLAVDRRWKLDFLTNGVRLDRIDVGLLKEVDFNVFNVSFDGASAETFDAIRVGADYHRVLENIETVLTTVTGNGAHTAVNATLLASNLHEAPDMVRMWNARGVDLIRLFAMQARDTGDVVLAESLYGRRWQLAETLDRIAGIVAREQLRIGVRHGYFGSARFAVPQGASVDAATLYSKHPACRKVPGVRQEMQLGTWPGMPFPCRSPFVYCRIRWDGKIDLCNNRAFEVGDIADATLPEIWSGETAGATRQQLMQSTSVCQRCDYHRFCISSRSLDLFEKESHFAGGLLDNERIVNF